MVFGKSEEVEIHLHQIFLRPHNLISYVRTRPNLLEVEIGSA